MKPDAGGMDSAFPVMAMDILSNVLSRADNPGDLGTYLTEEVRDLTGARCVLLIQCLSTSTVIAHRVVSVNPLRRREWAESADGKRLCEVVHRVTAAQLWRGEEPSEVAGLLRREGFELSMVFPLDAGGSRMGALLVLGLPDEQHITSVLSLVNDLSTIIALVLRNATFYERQEQLIQERTAQLRDNNVKLATELVERKEAEQKIAQLAAIVESSDDAIIGKTLEGVVTSWNKGAEKIYDYTEDEIVGKSISTLVPPGNTDEVSGILARIKHGEHIGHYETVRRRKDGQLIHVSLTISPVLDAEGKVIGASTISRDISERKRAEEALFEQQQVFRTLVENSPDIIARYDRDCRRIYVNPVYLKTAQISRQELLTTSPTQRSPLPVASAVVLQNLLRNVLDSGVAEAVDVIWPKADNIDYWYNIYASPEYDREGRVVSVMTVSRDITGRKRAEEERKAHIRFLEGLGQVDQAIKQGTNVEQMLSSVAGTVSSIFDCDRVWLFYPCDPDVPTFRVPVEITRPEYPGAGVLNADVPMSPDMAQNLREALASDVPVIYIAGTEKPVNKVTAEQFGVQSQMFVALYPKLGKPWVFGMHQCSYPRIWTKEEEGLFAEISRRISDGLSGVLYLHELQESEERFRATFEQAAVGIAHAALNGQWLGVNQKLCDIVGYSREELLQKTFQDITYPEDLDADLEYVRQVLAGEIPTYSMEKRYIRKDGSLVWVNLTVSVVHHASGEPAYFVSVIEDITQRKRAEEVLHRLNRELRAVTSCNQTMVRAVDEQPLLNDICHIVCDKAGYRLAWVGYAEHDNAKTVRPVAWAGIDSGYIADARLTWADDTERGQGPAGEAIRSGEVFCVQDFATDPEMAPWRESALLHGYRSGIALPLKDERANVFGVLLIYSAEVNVITPDEIRLLEELSGDLAFGIITLRTRAERKRADEALRQSEDKYRVLTESIKDVVWTLDTETMRFLYVSPSVRQLRGYTTEEVLSQPVEASLTPDGVALLQQVMHRQVEEFVSRGEPPEMSYTAEFEQPRKDGSTVWTEVVMNAYRDEQTGHICVRGVSRDITDRRKIASDLAASRAALLEAQTIAHIGDWTMYTATGTFVWSDELYTIHGVQPGTPMSHSAYLELIHPDDRKCVLDALQSSMIGRVQEFTVDYRVIRPDKAERFIALTGKTVADSSGNLTTLRGTMQDMTERKRAEAEREAMQAQLLQSQKMEAIGELAGGVAHDFNNLLTGILGNVALMRDTLSPSDPLRENLSLAETAARQAADLTRGLLTFTRSAVITPTPVCINDAVETALVMLRQSLPATIDIKRRFEPAAWNVLIDQSQMTQIILNLGINARDAMDGKGAIIVTTHNVAIDSDYIRTHPGAHAGEHVLLRFSDTGPGIAPEVLEHIFEPFFTTKPEGQGTGLGLPIVYGAVTQAEGWITTESLPGLGATFDIYLPRSLAVLATRQRASPAQSQPRRTATILVVEDEPVVATVAQSLLTRSGCTVAIAHDGAQALEIINQRAGQIDLILLDMTMPGMSTADVVRGIRLLDTRVPILLNSGYTSGEVVKQMLDDGSVQGFLGKPYDLQQLMESILPLLPQ